MAGSSRLRNGLRDHNVSSLSSALSSARRTSSAIRGRAPRKPTTGGKAIILISTAFLALFTIGALIGGVFAVYSYVTSRLPSVEIAASRQTFQSTFIYDRKGRLLYEVLDPKGGKRVVVKLEDISPHAIDATIAIEDARFFSNPGVDVVALARALWQNLTSGEIESGASTITMQVVRNVLLDPTERYEENLGRKAKEALLAFQLTQRFTKDEILGIYLNEINYGGYLYGIEAAAQGYFAKSAKDLTVGEAALLAGLPQSPTDYNPLTHPDAALQKQQTVLQAMVRQGYLDPVQADLAASEKLVFQQPKFEIKAPHFALYVRDQLVAKYGADAVYHKGLHVYTTLDLDMLEMAEKAAREHIEKIRSLNANNAAVVAIDPKTGEVLVMMGSIDYYDGKIDGEINMAVSDRQPGSSLKPFAYAYAFDRGIFAPGSVVEDKAIVFKGLPGSPPYVPHNHDGQYHGMVTLRQALASSLNIPAVMVLERIGIANFLDTLRTMGITSLNRPSNQYGLSVILGGAEVTVLDNTFGYCTFANNGLQVGEPVSLDQRAPGLREYEPVTILKITDAQGNMVFEHKQPVGKQVIRPETAYMITSVLSDDEARAPTYGRHSFLELSRPAAAKTGTTEYFQDGWTVGYTPDLVTGVWVGNANMERMKSVYAISGAGYIWHNFMEEALKGKPVTQFPKMTGFVKVTVCVDTGMLPSPRCPCETRDVEFPPDLVPKTVGQCTTTPTPKPKSTPTPLGGVPLPTPSAQDPTSPIVTVPNVVGLPESDARRVVEAAGLMTTYTNWQTAADVADKSFFYSVNVGAVLSQQPQAGSRVPRGTTVLMAARRE